MFEQALGEVGVAYEVRGGEGFYQRPEGPRGHSALVRVSRPAAQLTGADLLAYVKEVFAKLGMVEKEPEGAGARERWQSLRALFELCRDILHAGPELNIQALLGQLHTRQEAKQPPTLKGVTLASLHAAKGLEWDAVFLVGLSDGSLPIQHALKKTERSHAVVAEEIEEERRLFYVGITRARRHLELSWSLARPREGVKLGGAPASWMVWPSTSITRRRARSNLRADDAVPVAVKNVAALALMWSGFRDGAPSALR